MKIVPIQSAQSKKHFCALTASWIVQKGFEELQTNYLKPNHTLSLLSLSEAVGLLATGVLDCTDALDPNISLDKLAILFVKDGVHRIYIHDVTGPTTSFVAAPDGNYRQLNLNHEEAIFVPSDSGWQKVSVRLFGQTNLELGVVSVTADTCDYPTALADSVRVIGYSLNAYRVNNNRQTRAA